MFISVSSKDIKNFKNLLYIILYLLRSNYSYETPRIFEVKGPGYYTGFSLRIVVAREQCKVTGELL